MHFRWTSLRLCGALFLLFVVSWSSWAWQQRRFFLAHSPATSAEADVDADPVATIEFSTHPVMESLCRTSSTSIIVGPVAGDAVESLQRSVILFSL
ncbi:uncharacterized protein [Physcomitrium patens]|uniref:uncharacterized protein isoform X2 n=1 Tax=Physcomitrium patens TaxID=3218 RepID=UPI000D15826F|nr:uncharacterized protein LOC112286548 isoform X3 [Physcomitrium patens]|eukprot:XP_024384276.1 uncharacterized protein LOC112286548 isoform X3 [Physcomitrella patens]